MHRRNCALALTLVLLGAAACSSSSDSGRSGSGGAEIGLSGTTIRIGVLTDTRDPILGDLFAGSASAVTGWAKYVNAQGGVRGHRIAVDLIDIHANAADASKALQRACREDFALVGVPTTTFADLGPVTNCKDSTGAKTGLPDFATLAGGPGLRSSKVTFPAMPSERDARQRHAQRYKARTAIYSYLKSKFVITHGLFVQSADSQEAKDTNAPRFYAAQHVLNIKADGGYFEASAFDTTDSYAPFVGTIKRDKSQFAESGAGYRSMLDLRKAADAAGVDTVKAWACPFNCYERGFLSDSASDGTYISLPFVPYLDPAEQAAVPAVKAFVSAVGGASKANGFGAQAWASALLFQRVIEDLATTPSSPLTRKSALADVRTITDFDAGGMIGPTDVGHGLPSPCVVLGQVRDHKFVRVLPAKPGGFDCRASNITTFEHDIWAL